MSQVVVQKSEKRLVIDTDKCTGCDLCMKACPNDAILKHSNYDCLKCVKYCLSMQISCKPEHYIFCIEKCDACGLCVETCPVNAVHWVKTSLVK